MDLSQRVQGLKIKLESIQQENKIIRLEQVEYEKEINFLKQQNEQLIEEKDRFFQLIQVEQIQLSHSKSLSDEIKVVNMQNADLTSQISEYQSLTHRLNNKNKALQKEVQMYQIRIKELNKQQQQQQQKHKNYVAETLAFENKINELENECDTLREIVNDLSNSTTEAYESNQSNESIGNVPNNTSTYSLYRLQTVLSTNSDAKALFDQLHLKSQSYYDTITDDDIINQLEQFGYSENEIMSAIDSVEGVVDINTVLETLENDVCNKSTMTINIKLRDIEMEKKLAEINTLKHTNKVYLHKMNTLKKRIKFLKNKVSELKINRDVNEGAGCSQTKWFWFAFN